MMSLKQTVINGLKWTVLAQIGKQGVSLLATAVLARKLDVTDYGLMGMAMVIIGFAGIFSEMGFGFAIVQKKELNERVLSSIYWTNLLIASSITLLIAASAPLAARFFKEPKIFPVLLALAPFFMISNMSVVHRALLQRNMLFQKIAQMEVVSVLISCVTAMVACQFQLGVWVLLLQAYTQNLCISLFAWASIKWKPSERLQLSEIRSVCSYSFNLMGFNIINYFARNADNTLIGRFLGTGELGLYAMARRLMQYPLLFISSLVGRVLFPAYCKIQHDTQAFKRAFLRAASLISFLTFPLMLGLCVLAEPVVEVFLSKRWLAIVHPIMILSLVGLNQSIVTTTGNIYLAKGKTALMFRVGFANSLIYILGVALGVRWGMFGVVIGYALADLASTVVEYSVSLKLIDISLLDLYKCLQPQLICAGIMVLIVWSCKHPVFYFFDKRAGLSLLIALGSTVYFLTSKLFNPMIMEEVQHLIATRGKP